MTDEINRKKMKAIRVQRQHGEKIRQYLSNSDLLDNTQRINTEKNFLFFPLKIAKTEIVATLQRKYAISTKIVEHHFAELQQKKSGNYRDHLSGISPELRIYLPSSYDIIGELAIVKLNEKVLQFSREIGKAIVSSHPNIRSVFQDLGVKGEFRVRDLKHLAGKNSTITTHKEFGIKLHMDISKVYFTPRLSNERYRISELICDNENILDMFAGIGPFAIYIAKTSSSSVIHANDINPESIHFMKNNIRLNKVENIIPHLGDAKNLYSKFGCNVKFDRIIMNLPHSSLNFLNDALRLIGEGTIHIYDIIPKEFYQQHRKFIKDTIENANFSLKELTSNIIKGYSPTDIFVVHDLKVKKTEMKE